MAARRPSSRGERSQASSIHTAAANARGRGRSTAGRIGRARPTSSTTSATAGPRRLFRSSSVVGRQPKRRQVSATEVAAAGTYRKELSRIEHLGLIVAPPAQPFEGAVAHMQRSSRPSVASALRGRPRVCLLKPAHAATSWWNSCRCVRGLSGLWPPARDFVIPRRGQRCSRADLPCGVSEPKIPFFGAAPPNNTACFPPSGGCIEQRLQRKLQRDYGRSPMSKRVADVLVEMLQAAGVNTCYAIAGVKFPSN